MRQKLFKDSPRYVTVVFLLLISFFTNAKDARTEAAASVTTDTTSSKVAYANALHDKVIRDNSLIEIKDLDFTTSLPIGIMKPIGNTDYLLVIDSLSADVNGGTMGMYMSIEPPAGSGQRITFGARNVRFDANGIKPGTKLMLLSNISIPFGNNAAVKIKGENNKTFVNIDCDGFQGMSVDADVIFSNSLLLPEDANGNILPNQQVTGSFQLQIASFSDLVATISLSPFQVKDLPGFGFMIKDATFDFSDVNNAAGIVYPSNYTTQERDNTWQGVFVREVRVRVPKCFKKKGNNPAPPSISARNLLIDDMGVSGEFMARNVLTLDTGRIANWKFSVDSMSIGLSANQLTGGSLAGKIGIPIIDPNHPLKYNAVIHSGGNYLFQIALTDKLPVPLFSAQMELYANSSLTIEIKNDQFLPRANLNGKISVGSTGDSEASLADLTFQGLQLQTIQPLLTIDAFDFSSPKLEQAIAKFPVTIQNIHVYKSGAEIGLSFNVLLNLTGGKGSFKADAGLSVYGQMSNKQDFATWEYKGISLNSIMIDIDEGAFRLKGSMNNYKNNSIYGHGFKGMISVYFKPGLVVMASAQFGSINNLRYWYADAYVILPKGIPIVTGINLCGFGGGAYYHMKKVVENPLALDMKTVKTSVDTTNLPGQTLSGAKYVPDGATGLGIRATVIIATEVKEVFNGSATFEISFQASGGVKSIGLEGNAFFMKRIDDPPTNATLWADLSFSYDFQNTALHGVMNAYVNVAGLIKGSGTNNRAGQVAIHYDPETWYIYIGHPAYNRRIGLTFLGMFTTQAYFVVGSEIPDMPPPPSQVTSILNLPTRDDGITGPGGGFAFGANMSIDTGDLTFLVFYARLQAGAGFDIMLKNYGSNAHCAGSTSPVGINGWYAKGQAYAYIQGEIGIVVDMLFVHGKYPILKAAAAVVLQANLPNPTWLFGKVGASYEILGGLVSGNVDFEVELGNKCSLQGVNALAGISVISKCSPADQEQSVDVFNAPQATFNMGLGKTFQIKDENDNTQSYRVMLDEFKLKADGKVIAGSLDWNSRNDVVAFNAIDVLPGQKVVTLSVKVHFEKQINGAWQPVMNGSTVAGEVYSSTFTTGPEPDYIVKSNILYSYPLNKQFNFYKDEYSSGYIQLRQGQTQPFTLEPGFKREGRLTASDGSRLTFDYSYDNNSKMVKWNIPAGMGKGKVYKLELLKVPAQANAAVDANVTTKTDQQTTGTTITTIKTREVEGTLELLQEKSIYDNTFRSSNYNNFLSKINALDITSGWNWSIFTGVDLIGVNLTGNELFDKYELQGDANIPKLVTLEAKEDNSWLNNKIKPLIYPQYPLVAGMYLDWSGRVPAETLGAPPLRAVFINQPVNDKMLEESEISGAATPPLTSTEIDYELVTYGFKDYNNLQNKAAVHLLRNTDANLVRLLTTPFPNIPKGAYGVTIKYILPGMSTANSQKDIAVAW